MMNRVISSAVEDHLVHVIEVGALK